MGVKLPELKAYGRTDATGIFSLEGTNPHAATAHTLSQESLRARRGLERRRAGGSRHMAWGKLSGAS